MLKSMTVTMLRKARLLAGLSARQAALLAGVAPSSVTRIEKGLVDPSVGTWNAILAACGYRCDAALVPNVDPDAWRAARRLLEPELGIAATEGSERWARRWEAAGLLSAADASGWARELCFRASQQACLALRPGSGRFRYANWRSVAAALEGAGRGWALTGGYAARFFTGAASANWPVFYVDDVVLAARAANLTPAADDAGATVTLVPFDDVTAAGTQFEGGVRLASFWQIVIDCFAGADRMPDQAEAMIGLPFSKTVVVS